MIRTRSARPSMLRLEVLENRAVPATFNVTTTDDELIQGNGELSLREAIFKANGATGADTIVLPAGVFKFARLGAGENANASGDYDVAESVTFRGAGAGLTVINGGQQDRLFDLIGAIDVRFVGLTLRNGGTVAGVNGGAIQSLNADIVVINCVLKDNRALLGGAINAESGAVTVSASKVVGNVSRGDGGGIRAQDGELTLTNSLVHRNLAAGAGGGFKAGSALVTGSTLSANSAGGNGGGIDAATLLVNRSMVQGNSSRAQGGGIQANTLALKASTVSGNTADLGGGGIAASNATATRCTLSGNFTDGDGGGCKSTTANLTNCTVSGNTAGFMGGGISAGDGSLSSCTIVENSAGNSGGGLFAGNTVGFRNSIIALNLAAVSGQDGAGGGPASLLSQGHNLIGDRTDFIVIAGDLSGDFTNPLNPLLGPLQNNGGPTKTHALLAGSPAIDKGDNAGAPATDQRGFPRKKDGNGDGSLIVDIGAFER
jgi:hypothetical protein